MIRLLLRTALAIFGFTIILLAGAYWVEQGPAPRVVASAYDVIWKSVTGIDPYRRCWSRSEDSTGAVMTFIGPRACYSFSEQRTFRGIYIDQFEGQQFIENAEGPPPYQSGRNVWFAHDEASNFSAAPALLDRSNQITRIWLVEFVGRMTDSEGGFGHLGMSDAEVLVDRMISAKPVVEVDSYRPRDVLR